GRTRQGEGWERGGSVRGRAAGTGVVTRGAVAAFGLGLGAHRVRHGLHDLRPRVAVVLRVERRPELTLARREGHVLGHGVSVLEARPELAEALGHGGAVVPVEGGAAHAAPPPAWMDARTGRLDDGCGTGRHVPWPCPTKRSTLECISHLLVEGFGLAARG